MPGHRDRFPATIDLTGVRIGATSAAGYEVTLRPPHPSDFHEWRRIRLRDQCFIEPFWVSSPLSWQDRHTETLWVRECLHTRRALRARKALGMAVEVEGRFAGQCCIDAVDATARCAELGGWIDSTVARKGLGAFGGALAIDFAFGHLGIRRIVAPICVDNLPAARSAERLGFEREATLVNFFDVGGHRMDHDLWAIRHNVASDLVVTRCKGTVRERVAPVRRIGPLGFLPADLPRSRESVSASIRFQLGSVKRFAPHPSAEFPPRRLLVPHIVGGRRVALRPARLVDLAALHRPGVSPRVLTGAPEFDTRLPSLRKSLGDRWSGRRLTYVLRSGDRVCGVCSLELLDIDRRSASLHLAAIGPAIDRQALVVSGRMVLEDSFRRLRLHRVAAAVDSSDDDAAALVSALGMHREGRLSDAAVIDQRWCDLDLWSLVAGTASDNTPTPEIDVTSARVKSRPELPGKDQPCRYSI